MARLTTHADVGDDFIASARSVVTTQAINVSAQVLFDSLAGDEDWTDWLGLDSVTFTTADSRGIGTTRTVTSGGTTIHEEFFAWERPHRLAFRAAASTLPVSGFAEDYVIAPISDTECLLTWTVALAGRPAILTPIMIGVMRRMAQKSLPRLALLLESRAS